MKRENLFYLFVFATIIISGFLVWLVPNVDIKIFGIIVHHFWFGIILFVLGFLFIKNKFLRILFFGVGAGLTIDQLVFMLLGAGGDAQYWSLPSTVGAIIFAILLFLIRRKIQSIS